MVCHAVGEPWVEFPLTLPSNVEIDSLTVCYYNFNESNYIRNTRLLRITAPPTGLVIHDDLTHYGGLAEQCYTSNVYGEPVDGMITLRLRFSFNDLNDSIIIGAIGVHVSEIPASAIGNPAEPLPESHATLQQNRPNPFDAATMIEYSLAVPGQVDLEVLDVSGRVVRTLFGAEQPAGEYRIRWDGTDDLGREMASGRYYFNLRIDGDVTSRGMVLLR